MRDARQLVDIVLVEDDARVAQQLLMELNGSGYRCRWVMDADAGLDAIRKTQPALVLLDLNLPDRSGFDVLRAVRDTPEVAVIVLTARLLGRDKVRALDLGADDYVTKPFWTEELRARIRAVLRRRSASTTELRTTVSFGPVTVDIASREVTTDGAPCHLTRTEFELLQHLVVRPNRVVMREHLVDAVLPGEDSALEALHAHMSRLRRKLGPGREAIRTVRGVGYRFDPGQADDP